MPRRSLALPVALSTLLLALAAPPVGAAPPVDVAPPRGAAAPVPETQAFRPGATLGQLQWAVRNGDRTAEWTCLSPGFKRRLSQRMGRTIDLADYTHFRTIQRRDREVRRAERALGQARMQQTRRNRDGSIRARIWFQGPLFFGHGVWVRMVRLPRWELHVRGEQPYWGFDFDKALTLEPHADGSFSVVTRDQAGTEVAREEIPAARVMRYRRVSAWYFDHLGELEGYFG